MHAILVWSLIVVQMANDEKSMQEMKCNLEKEEAELKLEKEKIESK